MKFRLALLSSFFVFVVPAMAQDGELLEYQQEIGGGIGLSSYWGDSGGGLMKHPGFTGSVIWRRNFNPRMVLKTAATMGHVNGNTKNEFFPTDPLDKTATGGTAAPEVHFGRNYLDLGAQFEFNFLGYGMGASYKGLHRWTPYLLAGAGVTICFGGGGKAAGGFNIPLGFGVRYKLKERLNIGFEWAIHFTTTDGLDDNGQTPHLKDPYGISSGMFKNKDCYSVALISLTYDISPKYRKCNN